MNRDFKEMRALCVELSETDDPVEAEAFRSLASNYDAVLGPPAKPISFSRWLAQTLGFVVVVCMILVGAAFMLPPSEQSDDQEKYTRILCTGGIVGRPTVLDEEVCRSYRLGLAK